MTPIRLIAGLLPLLATVAAVTGCGAAHPAASQGASTAMAARPAKTVVAAGRASAGWAAAAGRAVPRGGPVGVTFSQVDHEGRIADHHRHVPRPRAVRAAQRQR